MSQQSKQIPITPLDQKSFSGPIQMLKAAVPYFHPKSAKKMAMLARMLEVKSTMDIFSEEHLSICSLPNAPRPNMEDILKDIRKYCAAQEAEQIDQFLNLLNAVRLYNQYNDLFKNTDFSSMMNQMGNFHTSNVSKSTGMSISPEQIQMLQNLLHAQSNGNGKDFK